MIDSKNVMLAISNNQVAHKIKHVLTYAGYHVPEICTSGNEAIRHVRLSPPEILLINFEMHDISGLEAARIVGAENLCSVILMVGNAQKDYVYDSIKDYDITILVKPLNKISMINTVDIVLQARIRMHNLSRQLEKAKSDLENRKIIEKAKGILMKSKYISEGEAYRRIQKMSMDNRVSMCDVSMRICEYVNKI